MKAKRIFLIVLDSFGIGALPDADAFGDSGSNTLAAVARSNQFNVPNMARIGLFNIDGVSCQKAAAHPEGAYGRLAEASMGKDTTTGHWEIAGVISEKPMPTYPNGFPDEIISAFKAATGRGVLCNRPYSGTDVIRDFGQAHMQTGDLIVYTSADSVFQVAAHEDVVPVSELYRCCEEARRLLTGKHSVGRVIARPFNGAYPDFKRTPRRHDFSLEPPKKTMLDRLSDAGLDTIGVGKIYDIFAGRGVKETYRTLNNDDGMAKTSEIAKKDFTGLCFVNLVDFDMVYGHRNDTDGYAAALTAFDGWLGGFMADMRDDDLIMITADHGCDPSTPSTDHSREYTPLLIYGKMAAPENLGTKETFSVISSYILNNFKI